MLHDFRREEAAGDRRRSESALSQGYVPNISGYITLGYYLTSGSDYAVAEADGPEEIFRIVRELSDNRPDKADLLDNCGATFF